MLLKSSLLLFAATALAAVSASPAATAPTHQPAPPSTAPQDVFPALNPAQIKPIEDKLKALLDKQRPLAPHIAPNTTPDGKATPPAKQKRSYTAVQAQAVVDIHKYAQYARAAYQIMGFEWDCSKCATSPDLKGTVVIQFWDSTQHRSQGYVGYRKDSHEIIVAFRGTTNLSEMLNNLKFSLVDWNGAGSGAKVHSGFSAAYTSAANIVRTSIDGLLKKDSQAKVVFVGHSLGGAQASLAAADFVFRYPTLKTKVSLYTFGQPRVGNPVFANWMDRQDFPVFRVVHRTDLVSQLPPQVPIKAVEYQHHSEEVFYPLSGQLTFCGKNNPESDNCQNSVSTKQLSTTDHINYPGMEH